MTRAGDDRVSVSECAYDCVCVGRLSCPGHEECDSRVFCVGQRGPRVDPLDGEVQVKPPLTSKTLSLVRHSPPH